MKANLYKKENEQKILSLKTDKININLHIKDMDIDNKELVDEFMKLNLKPKLTEKKENGEVFTPKELINEMLDKLPEEVWSNKDLKWFDPAVGMGNFIIEVYWRLMEGLVEQIPDFDKRKKHIVENMLYVSELNEENIKHCDRVFSGQLNIYHGDTLKMPSDYFGVDKFDVIIGNPPWNMSFKGNSAQPLYHKFVEKFIDESHMFLFVTPSKWFQGGSVIKNFRNSMFQRKDIKSITHYDNAREFFDIEIWGGISYFLKDDKYSGSINMNGKQVDFTKYDIYVDEKYHNLVDKIKIHENISSILYSDIYKIISNDKRLKDKEFENSIKCFVNKKSGFIKYIKDNETYEKFWKVISVKASGTKTNTNKGFGNMFVSSPYELYSQTYISFKVKDEKEAESLLSYLKCKLVDKLLKLRKNTQSIYKETLKWIPLVPFDREWTDEKLKEYLQLTDEELTF